MTWLEIAKTCVEIVFYIVTGTAVLFGLRAWRNELRCRAKYETAKNMIVGAYRVRDSIKECQAPIMLPGEWAHRERPVNETPEDADARNSWYAYTKRFAVVADAVKNWYPSTVEAQALFGEEVRKLVENLLRAPKTLLAAIEMEHRALLSHSRINPRQKYENILYGIHPQMKGETREDDDFWDDGGFQRDLDASVEGIRTYFEPFIR